MSDMMILGEGAYYDTDSMVTGLNNNVVVVGSPGTGKTRYIVEPTLVCAKEDNLVVTCTKRRIYDEYAPFLKSRGYRILTLDLTRPDESDIAFDPLQFVESFGDIKTLAEMVIKADTRKEKVTNVDPYWDQAAIALLSAEITYVIMTKDDPKFSDVARFHNSISFSADDDSSISTSVDSVFAKLETKHPDCFAISCWHTFSNLPRKTAGCVISTLSAAMEHLFTPEINEMMEKKPCINFEGFNEQKGVLFIITSPVSKTLNSFVNMFYSQLFKSLFEMAEKEESGVLKRPIRIIADDFATGGRVANFPEYISIMREKGIGMMVMIQSQSQLNSIYGEDDATTIVNGCDTYVYLGGMDKKTCEDISVRVDLPVTTVMYMPIGTEYIFRRGSKPVITKRFDKDRNQTTFSVQEVKTKKSIGFRIDADVENSF